MKTAMKATGIVLLVVVLLAVGALLALLRLFSSDYVKSRVADMVEQKTGRSLSIGGDSNLSLYPQVAVELHDVALANPAGMQGPPLVKLAALYVNLKLLPLLQGQTEVDSLTLEDPQIRLQVDKDGRENWNFGNKPMTRTAPTAGHEQVSDAGAPPQVREVRIKNGVLSYHNAKTGQDEEILVKDLTLAPAQTAPNEAGEEAVSARGELVWRKEPFDVKATIASLADLAAGKPTDLRAEVMSRLVNASYEGRVTPAPVASVDGRIATKVASVRELAAFLGTTLPAVSGFAALDATGSVKGNAAALTFTADKLSLDGSTLAATGEYKAGKLRPFITARIDAERLDFNPYLDAPPAAAATNRSNDRSAAAGDTATPVDLSGLKALDGKFDIKAKQLVFKKAEMSDADLGVTLDNGLATARINKLSLYRGGATGDLTLDGRAPPAKLAGKLTLSDVLTGAILRDFAGFDKLAGKGNINLDLAAEGADTQALLASLKGDTKVKLTDGRFEGFDLGKLVGSLSPSDLPGGFEQPATRSATASSGKPMTAYDELSGQFAIDKGVATNKDFLMTGKYFKVRAAGTLNLVAQTLNLRLAPKLFSGSWSFTPAMKLKGPWNSPKASFDLLASLGGDTSSLLRSVQGLVNGNKSNKQEAMGLKTDAEVDAFLAGKPIPAANDNGSGSGTTSTDGGAASSGSSDPLGGLLKDKDTQKLLNKLFQ